MRRTQAWTLGVAAVATLAVWGYLAWLGRIPLPWAIQQKDAMFGWAMLELMIAVAAVIVVFARDRASRALRMVVTLVTAGIIVAMCEAMAGFGLIHWDIELQHLFGEDAPMKWKFDPDPALGWKRAPNDRWVSPSISDVEEGFHMRAARHKTLRFTYDDYGFRNPKTVPQADVVLLGDSYIEGGNADDSETLARRLEAQLDRPVESMGVAGYGTLQNLINLDWNAPKLNPKVAVFFFFEGNDLYDDAEIESMWAASLDYTKSELGMAKFSEFYERSFVRNSLRYVMRWMDPIVPNQMPYFGRMKDGPHKGERILFAEYAAVPWTPWVENRWNISLEVMRKAAALQRQRGVKTIFVFLPIKERVYWPFVDLNAGAGMEDWGFWDIRAQFQKFCEDQGDACLDLTGPFQASLAEGGMPHLPTDSHWSPEGTELVARELAPIVRRLLPVE